MMDFDLLKNEEKIETENGALGYKTTGSKLLDLSFKIPSLRAAVLDNPKIDLWEEYFEDAYAEDPRNTLRFLLYLRDARGGLGERAVFRNVMINMAKSDIDLATIIYAKINISYYGRWDDTIEIGFSDKKLFTFLIPIIAKQLGSDIADMDQGKPISLLAKWLPSENASSKMSQIRAAYLAKSLHMSKKNYRKTLSALRKYLNIVESQMSANKWDEIEYSHVPSKANLIYKDAFLRHDEERRNEFLNKVADGTEKINAKVLAPYEIIHTYRSQDNEDCTLEELWKALPAPEKQKNMLIVRDGSSSMTWEQLRGSNVVPMDVGDSIALYMSQQNTGRYKDKFITFSRMPKVVDLSGKETLYEKLDELARHTDCSNTNLHAVFSLLLTTAVCNNVPQEEIPDVLIISDMEFDSISNDFDTKLLMSEIESEWKQAGYKFPKLIFWNVAGRTNAIPMKVNENGVILVSGFSPAIANMVMSNELDPMKALLKTLQNERYDIVDVLFDLNE